MTENRRGRKSAATTTAASPATAAPEEPPTGADPTQSGPNLTRRTMAGLKWTFFSLGVGFGLQLLYQAIINRLLEPAVFGLMTAVLLTIRFSRFFSDLGVAKAIVQKPELDEDDIRAAFALSLMLGIIAFALVYLGAPLAGSYFRTPEVVPVLRLTGLSLVFVSLGTTSQGLLQRELGFESLAARELVSYAIGFLGVGVGLAAAGFGVWSLAYAQLVTAATASLLTFLRRRHSVNPLFSIRRMKPLYSYSVRTAGTNMMEWLGKNLDTFAVGRFFNSALLGQYNRAYFLTTFPVEQLTKSLSRVLFPGFSRIQQESERIRRVFLRTLSVATAVLLPVCAGIAISSRELVLTVLGPQWDVAIDLVPLLVVAAVFDVLSHFPGMLFDARAELNKKFALQASAVAFLLVFLLLARGNGLMAFATALVAGRAVKYVLFLLLLRRVIEISARDAAGTYVPALFATALVAAVVGASRWALVEFDLPVPVVLLGEMLSGALGMLIALRTPPLAVVRREIRFRLTTAGMLRSRAPLGRMARAALGPPTSRSEDPATEPHKDS